MQIQVRTGNQIQVSAELTRAWPETIVEDALRRFGNRITRVEVAMVSDSLFAGLGNGRIYRSDDRGDHWSLFDVLGEPPQRVLGLILSP